MENMTLKEIRQQDHREDAIHQAEYEENQALFDMTPEKSEEMAFDYDLASEAGAIWHAWKEYHTKLPIYGEQEARKSLDKIMFAFNRRIVADRIATRKDKWEF